MKHILELYRYTFKYRVQAILVIVYNLLSVIFNLISLALFIPFLQLIFGKTEIATQLVKPEMGEGLVGFFKFIPDYYEYTMQKMVQQDATNALFFVCVTVMISFLLKNLFRYFAIWYQSQIRMSVVRDVRSRTSRTTLILI